MPILNRQDAQEVDQYISRFFAAPSAGRTQALRRLFVEKLDFASATGAVSLANAPKNVALPPSAERIATMEGLHVVYVPLSANGPNRVRKAEAAAAAKLIADTLHGDLLLVMTNPSCSQLHVIYPTFVGATPSLRRMIIERDLPRRTAVQQLSNIFWQWKDAGSIHLAVDKAFDVEAVTKQFFEEYKRVFENVLATVKGFGPTEDEAKKLFVQTLFNRLMFIYFLSRKGWLKFNGNPDYLNTLRRSYPMQPEDKNFYENRLKVLFFDGLNKEDSTGKEPLIGKVPFLNGGLFDPLIEGDTRPDVVIPDKAIDLMLNDLFERYNFTVMESTLFDMEVAVDPEMLGKVFEELVTGRHESGSYYTPRPVVSFMCREALKGYLETQNTEASGEAIAAFVDHKDTAKLTLSSAPKIGEALARVKVVDPACGSGAYLLGMMQELVELRTALYSAQLSHEAQDLYNLKLRIIEQNIHGADIDPFAVNIAMLRLWLSLAIEYDGPVDRLPALPNLNFKIVCGDSLLGPDPSPDNYGTLFRHRIHQLAGQLATLKDKHMQATGQEKINFTKDIEGLKAQLREALAESAAPEGVVDWRVEFAEVFDEKEGFDIAVANPPYVSAIEFRRIHADDERRRLSASFQTARGAYDLYVVFFERAIQLLHANGFLSFITPNKYLAAPYATALRLFLHSTCSLHSIVDLSRVPVFANTQVYPVLSFLSKTSNSAKEINVLLPPSEGSPDFSPDSYRHISVGTDALNMLPDHLWGFLLSDGLPYLRKFVVNSRRLELLAQVFATTTAAEADEYGKLLSDGKGEGFKVVNTGTIEPYRSSWGVKRLRDHGTSYQRPYISRHLVSERRRNIYSAPKIIFAKIARTCEAILDERGDYAGLNVNCIYSPVQEISLEYLVAFLHSSVFNFIYQELFGSLRMAGGYLQFQAPQLRAIPIRIPDKNTHDTTLALVRRLTHELDNGMAIDDGKARGLLKQIDETIANMYGVTVVELASSARGSVPFESEDDSSDSPL